MTTQTHPRKRGAAMLLSTISPGLGHIYCGRFEAGIILFFFSMALSSLVPAAMLLPGTLRNIGSVAAVICLILWVYSVTAAGRIAQKSNPDYVLKDYNRAAVYILFSLMAIPIAIGWAIFIRTAVMTPYYVASDAMSPALQSGQRVLVSKLIYQEQPVQRDDIVAIVNPNRRSETNLRRIVALPGDRVETIGGELRVNGHLIARVQKALPITSVPNGSCFALADRQGIAEDSIEYGPVPLRDVIGQVQWIYWPHWMQVSKANITH